MSGRAGYQAIPMQTYGAVPNTAHRSRTSVAFSQLYGIFHVVVGAVLPLTFAFKQYNNTAVGHEKELQFWHLDAYYIYILGASVLAMAAMQIFRLMETHDGLESHQAASTYIKGGAALFGACGILQNVFKLGSVIDGSNHGHGDHDSVAAMEAALAALFILLLWLFVCAHSNKCITKWKRFSRIFIMLLWAACMSCWIRDFVTEVMDDLEHQYFNSSICRLHNRTRGNKSTHMMYALGDFKYHVTGDGDGKDTFQDIREKSSSILIPGAMEFYLIMSGFMYVMYGNIGRQQEARPHEPPTKHRNLKCSFIGLGLGFVVLIASIAIVVTHYLTEKHASDNKNGVPSMFYYGFIVSVYPMAIIGNLASHFKMRRSDDWQIDDGREDELRLPMLLMYVSASGLFITSVFTIIASSLTIHSVHEPVLLLIHECLKVIDIFVQVIFLYDALHRKPPENFRPTFMRNIMMFLIFTNFMFWWTNIYELKDVYVSPIQYCFYGFNLWSIVLHLTTPLGIYFRFHSCVLYLEIWLSG
ncbi:proton channel OtopLc-like [Ptychodera flava]|uniref:proton channel OtopLc-like n=1 Tax=Ptychodera flava TaxID=63121 RepID=UPI003969D0DC